MPGKGPSAVAQGDPNAVGQKISGHLNRAGIRACIGVFGDVVERFAHGKSDGAAQIVVDPCLKQAGVERLDKASHLKP